jgi:hypothetical protein
MKMRHDTPKSHTQQRKFKTYPVAMSGVLESDLHVSVYADGEVNQVGSRVELFEAIRRDRRTEGLSIRELAERHKVHHRRAVRQALASASPPHARSTWRGHGRQKTRGRE